MKNRHFYIFALLIFGGLGNIYAQSQKDTDGLKYKLLATTKTSTMQKEMDEVSAQGYRILVGSPTSGTEMAVFLSRETTMEAPYKYKLLATSRTGTMQKELNEAADGGFRLIPSTMIAKNQLLGGVEIVMTMERPPQVVKQYEYKLLATSRTSTLQKEVTEAQTAGFVIVGMVSRGEHMVVMERQKDVTP
ncbi:MAG: hypothetical protein H7070_07125 [Saprospiraceae bacterium]|nr:hypothetical protein [Pyrinomonadaceae bacterium]